MERNSARTGLVVFGAITATFSVALQAWMIRDGRPLAEQAMAVTLLMWIPGLSSIATRVVCREGFADVSFRFGGRSGRRILLLAWIYPIPIGLAAYGLAWASGLAPFAVRPLTGLGIDLGSDAAHFVLMLVQSLVLLTPIYLISSFGEELGWRGYMLPRLIQAGSSRPLLVSGVIWGAWHVPLMLTGQYVHSRAPVLAVCMFLVGITGVAFLLGWMRLRTGSVWPAVLGHASWNAIIQGVFDRATPQPSLWVGEGGVLTVAAIVPFTIMVLRVAKKRREADSMERFT